MNVWQGLQCKLTSHAPTHIPPQFYIKYLVTKLMSWLILLFVEHTHTHVISTPIFTSNILINSLVCGAQHFWNSHIERAMLFLLLLLYLWWIDTILYHAMIPRKFSCLCNQNHLLLKPNFFSAMNLFGCVWSSDGSQQMNLHPNNITTSKWSGGVVQFCPQQCIYLDVNQLR